MLPKSHRWLRILSILFLFSCTGPAQNRDSLRFIRNTLHVNLLPGTQQEVQLSYERALNPALGLEVMLSGRIPYVEHKDGRSFGTIFLSSGYEDRVYRLSYESSFGAGVHLRAFLSPEKRRGFLPFVSPGILYRYSFFDDKCYWESNRGYEYAYGQEFSLRKHEVSVRLLLGVKCHFYVRGGKSAFSTEASLGFGAAKRFGTFLDVQRSHGYGLCPDDTWPGQPVDPPRTSRFNVTAATAPINLKIGYSWGQSPR